MSVTNTLFKLIAFTMCVVVCVCVRVLLCVPICGGQRSTFTIVTQEISILSFWDRVSVQHQHLVVSEQVL